jgi:hypothetical protein
VKEKAREEECLAAGVSGCFRACVVREVLQCFVVQASAQAHGDRVHKPAAKNIECPVPTYVMPPDTHARRAIRWRTEFLVAWCFMHVPKQRDNRSIRGQSRVQGYDARMPRGRVQV